MPPPICEFDSGTGTFPIGFCPAKQVFRVGFYPLVIPVSAVILVMTAMVLIACHYSIAPDAPAPNSVHSVTTALTPSPQPARGIQPDSQMTKPDATRAEPLARIPACAADISTPLFDTLPIDPSEFLAFRPLGFMSPPIHMFPAKHSAFSMTLPGQKPVAKPVRAPGPVWVAEIWEASFSTGGANYQVFVYPCREVRVYFGHLASLSRTLLTALETSAPKCNSFFDGTAVVTTCRHENMSIFLRSGEQLGTGPDSAGVDLGVVDFRRPPAAFVETEHYDHFYPYYASPLDYFTAQTKKGLESKPGSVFGGNMRTAEPIGGTFMQDKSGTAQGNWFFPGKYHRNSTDLSPSLGLAHDYVGPMQPVMAIGNSVKGMNMGLYSFEVEAGGLTNRDFGEVRADGNTYCYDGFLQGRSEGGMPLGKPSGILLMSLTSDTTLKIELNPGSSCRTAANWAFTGDATAFER